MKPLIPYHALAVIVQTVLFVKTTLSQGVLLQKTIKNYKKISQIKNINKIIHGIITKQNNLIK